MITTTKTKSLNIKTSFINKQILIKIAKEEKDRPSQKTKIGRSLTDYTIKSSFAYDESFNKQIRNLRPDWFVKSSAINKQLLIRMAKDGEPRPHYTTKLGRCLCNYTDKSHGSYDESFNKQIRNLRPDWFVKSSAINKQLLIRMAKDGEPRPHYTTKLGRCLCNYTDKSSPVYCESFDKQIRKLRLDWFKK